MHTPDDPNDSIGARMLRGEDRAPGLGVDDDQLLEKAREELELDEDAERSEGA